MNFLVDVESLERAIDRQDVSVFLKLLQSEVPGGLESIPYSLEGDLAGELDRTVLDKSFRKQLPLLRETVN